MVFTLLMACTPGRFNVSTEGAVLPVQVVGDPSLGLAVFVEGGPGGASHARRQIGDGAWADTVEQRMAVAYYDQRGTGNTWGDNGDLDEPLGQHSRDLVAVVDALRSQTDAPEIWLISHSYGGFLCTLTLAETPDLVDAWVSVAGSHNERAQDTLDARVVLLRKVAQAQVDAGDSDSFWEESLEFLAENPEIQLESAEEEALFTHLRGLHDRLVGVPEGVGIGDALELLLASRYNALDGLTRSSPTSAALSLAMEEQDLTPMLQDLELPMLHVTGDYDIQVPPSLVSGAPGEHLGVPGGHHVLWQEAERFDEALGAFSQSF